VIFVRQEKRLSGNGALNLCLGQTRGRYVLYTTAHDVLLPDCISTLAAALDADSTLSYAFGGFLFVTPTSSEPRLQTRPPYRHSGRRELSRLAAGGLTEACATLMRLDAVRAVRGFDERTRRTNHWDLVSRLCLVGDVRYVRRILSQYIFVGRHCSWREEIEERIGLFDRHATYFELAGLSQRKISRLRARFARRLEQGLAYREAEELSLDDRRILSQRALGRPRNGTHAPLWGWGGPALMLGRLRPHVRALTARLLTRVFG